MQLWFGKYLKFRLFLHVCSTLYNKYKIYIKYTWYTYGTFYLLFNNSFDACVNNNKINLLIFTPMI